MTLLEAMILILFGVLLIRKKIDFKKYARSYFFWLSLLVILAAILAVIVSPNKLGALGILKAYFIEPVLFYIILVSLVKEKKEITRLVWMLGISAVYISLFGIWQKFSAFGVPLAFLNKDGNTDRIVSIYGYPNAVGLYLGPIIILFTGFLFQKAKSYRLASLKVLIIALSFIAIVFAQSEAAVLAVLAVCTIWGLIYKKTRLPFLILIVIFMAILFFSQDLQAFVYSKLFLKDWSGMIRRLIWGETWVMLKDNWLFGAGLAGYQLKIVPYHIHKFFEIYLYPHNILFNFWSETGLFGVFVFIAVWLRSMLRSLSDYFGRFGSRVWALTLFFTMVEILIHGLVDAPYFKNDLSVLFWLILFMVATNRELSLKKGD